MLHIKMHIVFFSRRKKPVLVIHIRIKGPHYIQRYRTVSAKGVQPGGKDSKTLTAHQKTVSTYMTIQLSTSSECQRALLCNLKEMTSQKSNIIINREETPI